MALSYEDTSTLMNDVTFRGRVKVACLKYADYIWAEAASTPGHSSRIKWAQQTFNMPDGSAAQITPAVVMDPAVQDQGSAINDAGLQSATENAINKIL